MNVYVRLEFTRIIMQSWPPEYKVIRHKRARSVKLRASRYKGLEITVPVRFSLREIPSVLEDNKAWIIKQLERLQTLKTDELPTVVEIPSCNKKYIIRYLAATTKHKLFLGANNVITIMGDIENKEACRILLSTWLKKIAKPILQELIEQISSRTKLTYSKLTIRDQSTRWGSCTSKKNINLNYKLILLPLKLAEHIIIHELCHTKHLNHSSAFWQLVATHDSNWQEHREEMKLAETMLPGWL